MKAIKQDILKYKNTVIVPDPDLACQIEAYQINRTIYVSPAIFELLHDDDVKKDVFRPVRVINVTQQITKLIKEIIEIQTMNK